MSEETQSVQGNTETASGNESTEQVTDQQAATETTETTEVSAESVEYQEFTLPEGVELDSEMLDKFKPFAQELGLDQDGAQKLVDMGSELATKIHQAGLDNWQKQVAGWGDASRADKEIGGKDFDANLGTALKAIDTFGTTELKEILEKSGLGNHPELVRFAYKIGKAITGDTAIVAGSAMPAKKSSMYAYMNEKTG